MLKNYLITAVNSLLKNKLFTCINLIGLAIGLASTISIGLFVADELSYDTHYPDADRIYRVSRDFPTQNLYLAANAPLAAGLLKADFPEIEYSARLFGAQILLSHDDVAFYESDTRFADPDFFTIFKVDWIAGEPAEALARPNTVVLTESIAIKYFGTTQVLGQRLMAERAIPLEVTGVIRDLPHNTHLDLAIIGSLETIRPMAGENFFTSWGSNNFHTYIKLKPDTDIASVSSQFPAFLQRHFQENAPTFTGMTAIPIEDIHLHSTRRNEITPPGSINTVYVFSATAVFILMIACFNFMNLSTARSTRRGKEVGIRKSLGASRAQVISQFVGESMLMTALATLVALVLVEAVLPTFNALIDKELMLGIIGSWRVPAAIAMLVLAVGLFAGSYPAFFLSAFKPVQVLRSALAKGGSALFRNALVILQFSIAIVLVVATLVVIQQMRFARETELGFQREQVLIINGSPTVGLGPQWDAMRQELLRNPDILGVTSSGQTPLEINTNNVGVAEAGNRAGGPMPIMRVDYDFFTAYDIPLLAGRGFSSDFPADRLKISVNGENTRGNSFVLNRLAVEEFGWTPEQAVGQALQMGVHGGTIVGVVENSYFESVRTALKPMLFFLPQYMDGATATMPDASLRLSGNNVAETLDYIDGVWKQFMPDFPMARYFLDDDFNALFRAEQQQGQLFYYFALLAIFIACMGLYGLASFNAERRTKEIGVRKVMGGSVWSIVLLLTNDFSKLVLIANVIAWPVAYFAMERWLQNFAYRVDLTPVIFIGSGLIALSIAWVTVGGTAAKAASAKPVLALRYE